MNTVTSAAQHAVCARWGTACEPPTDESRVGVALQTRGMLPLNALRHKPEGGTCGWYVWWGGDIDASDDDFFQPLCAEHLPAYCPELMPYLALPPGWRVQLAPGHEDVWYDEELLSS